ncbi:MAG: hypothetical protein ABI855_10855 [Bacteroidota bacterium]
MANPNVNRIDTTISAPDMTHITDGIAEANLGLEPYAKVLTEDEREDMFSLAVENEDFADAALEEGQLLNAELPPVVQTMVSRLGKDLGIFHQLDTVENTLMLPILLKVKDTKRLAAHEGYTGALAIYKMIEAGAAMGLPGFQAAYDRLKARFAGQGGRPAEPGV